MDFDKEKISIKKGNMQKEVTLDEAKRSLLNIYKPKI